MAKNELQRLRNIARAKKTKVPGVGLTPTTSKQSQGQSSEDLKKASELATKSTASLGKFQQKLPNKLQKQVKTPKGKKRQFDPLVHEGEKEKNMKVFEQISSKRAKLDVTKAVGHQINSDERARSDQKKGGKKGGGKKQGGKQRKTFTKGKKGGKAKGGKGGGK